MARKLFILFLAFANLCAFARPLAAQDAPAVQGPLWLDAARAEIEKEFPLDTWPPGDTSPCADFLDDLYRLTVTATANMTSECTSRFYGKKGDYGWISAHALAILIIPEFTPAVLHEFKEEGKKDLLFCMLTGMYESSTATPEAKLQFRTGLNQFLEVKDSYGDFNSAGDLRDFLKRQPMPNLKIPNMAEIKRQHQRLRKMVVDGGKDVSNPLLFSGWNVYGLWQTGEVLWKGAPDSDERLNELTAAVSETRGSCDYEFNLTAIKAALVEAEKRLNDIRTLRRISARELMCSESGYKKVVAQAEKNGGVIPEFASSMNITNQNLKDKIKYRDVQDSVVVAKMRQMFDDYAAIKVKLKELEQNKPIVRTRLKEAEEIANKCDFAAAEKALSDLRHGPLHCNLPILLEEQKAAAERVADFKNRTESERNRIEELAAWRRDVPCSELESATREIQGLINHNHCLDKDQAAMKIGALKTAITASKSADDELWDKLRAAAADLEKCDVTSATALLESANTAELRRECLIHPAQEKSPLEEAFDKRNAIIDATKKVSAEIAKILEHAQRAREYCDGVRLQKDSEEIAQLIQGFSAVCSGVPPEAAAARDRIREFLTKGLFNSDVRKQVATLTAAGAKTIKACDAPGAQAIAAQLDALGKDCGYDGRAEAARIRSQLDEQAKEREALARNVAAVRAKLAQAAENACTIDPLKQIEAEALKLRDQFKQKCQQYPGSVDADIVEIDKIVHAAPAQFLTRRRAAAAVVDEGQKAAKACDALGVLASADQIDFGVPCLEDPAARSAALRAEADQTAKREEALAQNVRVLLGNARTASTGCNFSALKSAATEIDRLVDGYAGRCGAVPQEVSGAVNETQSLVETADKQIAGEEEIAQTFDRMKASWAECKLGEVQDLIKLIEQTQREKLTNPACPAPWQVGRVGPFQVNVNQMDIIGDSVEAANQLLTSCASMADIEKQLQMAELQLVPLTNALPKCDVSEVKSAITIIRRDGSNLESQRKAITDALGEGRNLIESAKKEEGRAKLKEATALIALAEPGECFSDLAQSADIQEWIDQEGDDNDEELDETDDDDEVDEVELIPEDGADSGIGATPTPYTQPTIIPTATPMPIRTDAPIPTSTPLSTLPPVSDALVLTRTEMRGTPDPKHWTVSWSSMSTSGSAQYTNNGATASYTWSVPSQITFANDIVTIGFSASAGPNSNIAPLIDLGGQVTPRDQAERSVGAMCNPNESKSDSKSIPVTFYKGSTEAELRVVVGWTFEAVYLYKASQ